MEHPKEWDKLSYDWVHYAEPGSYSGKINLLGSNKQQAHFIAPKVSEPEIVHIVLIVQDDGTPSLFSYCRIIVTIEPM